MDLKEVIIIILSYAMVITSCKGTGSLSHMNQDSLDSQPVEPREPGPFKNAAEVAHHFKALSDHTQRWLKCTNYSEPQEECVEIQYVDKRDNEEENRLWLGNLLFAKAQHPLLDNNTRQGVFIANIDEDIKVANEALSEEIQKLNKDFLVQLIAPGKTSKDAYTIQSDYFQSYDFWKLISGKGSDAQMIEVKKQLLLLGTLKPKIVKNQEESINLENKILQAEGTALLLAPNPEMEEVKKTIVAAFFGELTSQLEGRVDEILLNPANITPEERFTTAKNALEGISNKQEHGAVATWLFFSKVPKDEFAAFYLDLIQGIDLSVKSSIFEVLLKHINDQLEDEIEADQAEENSVKSNIRNGLLTMKRSGVMDMVASSFVMFFTKMFTKPQAITQLVEIQHGFKMATFLAWRLNNIRVVTNFFYKRVESFRAALLPIFKNLSGPAAGISQKMTSVLNIVWQGKNFTVQQISKALTFMGKFKFIMQIAVLVTIISSLLNVATLWDKNHIAVNVLEITNAVVGLAWLG